MAIIILAANPTSVAADGTSTITLDVTVLDDTTGLPMAGTAVTLSADGSDNTFGLMNGTTDANGVFQTTLESTLAQTETVTVAAGGAQQTASVSFSPTLAFADANIGYANAPLEGFTIGGLDTDDNGTVTFSDGNPADNQVIAITNGVASASTVDLSGMADGAVTASLSVSDAAGNSFTANAGATLDRDAGKQAALSLTIAPGKFSAIGDGSAQWFPLSDFGVSFSNSTTIGSATGGAGAGKATLNPLSLTLPSDELAQLYSVLFSGSHLSGIEVAGYANSGGTQKLVDDYLFRTDFLTAASTGITGAQQLSVDYGQVQLSYYKQSPTSTAQPPTQVGWDQVTNKADPASINPPRTDPIVAASPPTPSVYYVQFVDANGTALTGDGGAQWLQLSDFGVSFSNSSTIGSATGGAGAGKTTFNPLSLTLPSDELAHLYSLLFSGTHLSQIEVAGYANVDGTQERVDDYLFRTDFVTGISTGISGAQQLSVDYGQVQQTYSGQSSTGTAQPPTQIGWDIVANKADPTGVNAPATGPVATASTPAPSVYYVQFVDANGTALTGDGGAQWFQLSDFGVSFSNSSTIGSATGGAGAGKTTFNPLSLTLPSDELAQLYSLLFSGTHLSQIEVAGYANVGGTQERVDDYLFRTDFVTGISTGITGAQQLSVDYGQVQQTHSDQSPTGTAQPSTPIGWDITTNKADPAGINAPPTGTVATASTPAPSVYYVQFVDANGAALTGDGGAQWFQLSDFGVSFSNSSTIGSATGGAGAGKTTFNPLSLTLPSDELAQLYSLLFSGTHLSQIEVAGYANVGGTQERVDDYLFRTDFVKGISTDTSGAQQLSVDYGQVQETHSDQSPTGTAQPPTPIGWDITTNKADPTGINAPRTGPVATATTPAPSAYYVEFVGADGNPLTTQSAASAVPFTIAGLDPEDTGTVTFTDSASNTVAVPVNGTTTNYFADLHTLADGLVTSSLQINTDSAGNTFQPVGGPQVTLDQDTDEQTNLQLSFVDTLIGEPGIKTAHFAVSGLDATDDTAVITLSDTVHSTAVTVHSDGTYTADLTEFNDGTITAAITVSDTAGNRFSSASINSATLDTTTSESAIADAAVTTGTDSNSYINAQNFNGGATTLTGAAEAGDTVSVSVNGGQGQPATVNPDGTWSLPLMGLSDGESVTAVATATDPAGNTAMSAPFSFTVDTTTTESAISDTAVTIGTDSKSYINAAHFNGGITTLTGTAEAGDTVSVSVNAGPAQAATMLANGAWSMPVSWLTDGEVITAVATATDPAGNTAMSAPFSFTVDTTTTESAIADAAVTTGTDNNSYINAQNFDGGATTLTGTAEAGDTVSVSVNGGQGQAATVNPDGTWSLPLTGLSDGESVTAVATATDPAGNTAMSAAFSFMVDTTTTESAISDTAVTIGTDSKNYINAAHFNGGITTLTGTAEAGDTVSVSVNGGLARAATVLPNGAWSMPVSWLTDGEIVTAVATATDPAGNTAISPTYSFTVDSEPGVTPVLSFATNVIDAAADSAWPLTVSGLDDETGTVRFADAFGHSASVNVTGNGTYYANLSSLKDGPVTSTLSLSDPAGNQWSVPGSTLTMVGAPATGSTLVQLPSSSTGNLGTVGPNGPTVIDASQTHNVTFQSGNGPNIIIAGSNDTVYADNGPDTLVGAAGAALHAGNGPQTLYGAPGDTLFGGKSPDTFAFEPGFGLDAIFNFQTNKDVLQFNPSVIGNFFAAMHDAKQIGANTVFTIDSTDKITLENVNVSSLTSGNFRFS